MTRRAFVCASAVSVLLTSAQVAFAQPSATDLGRFDDVASRSIVQTPIFIDAANPVRWFTITVPRISNPYRYLDIFTQNQTGFDTEIALYASDGTLIATDDDDGADLHSALSFGITDPGAPLRVNPTAFAGQAAGLPNDGRDGVVSGPSPAGPTVATYYIAVTEYNATFANNFSVTRTVPPLGLFTSLAVRMNAPGGEMSPVFLLVGDESVALGSDFLSASVRTDAAVSGVTVDLTSVGVGVLNLIPMPGSNWRFGVPVTTTTLGPRPMTYRATNAAGDITVAGATIHVLQRGYTCYLALDNRISPLAGTTVYTYDTTQGDVDGPWTANCFSQAPTGNDIWFRWNPDVSGTATISTCNSDTGAVGPQPDTLLGIRRLCFDPVFFACADDTPGCGFGTRLSGISINAGQEYNICVRAWSGDIVNGRLAITLTQGCDPIDFNADGLFPDTADIDDFLAVFAGLPCPSTGTACNTDIDFNNDGLFPDTADIDAFLSVFAGGACV